jgi:branched-subunit amino acid aminotransferase/4-amino-4-deoxychorismate lyase
MRAVLLADERWGAVEQVLTRDDLHRCDGIVVCSALRGTVRANLCE